MHKDSACNERLIVLMHSKLTSAKLDRDTSFKLIQLSTALSKPKIAALFASDERFELDSGMLALNKGFHSWRPFHAALEARGYPLTPAFVGNLIEAKLKPLQEENAALKAEVGELKQMLGQVLGLLQAKKESEPDEATFVRSTVILSKSVEVNEANKNNFDNTIK
jgi:hypothetical protein